MQICSAICYHFLWKQIDKKIIQLFYCNTKKCLQIYWPQPYFAQNMNSMYFTMDFTLLKKLIYQAQL
jgi:hypothetical protein